MKKILLLSALLFATFFAKAQTFPAPWAARLQNALDSVNTAIGNTTGGASAAVYMPGYGLWRGATGISSPGVPLNTGMRMLIASCSKVFMAVTMLKLQEAGALSLEDHVGKYVYHSHVDTSATIRQLLSHESGMADLFWDRPYDPVVHNMYWNDSSRVWTAKEYIDSTPTPLYTKGRGHRYSNAGYALCTMIIKEATGQTYWQKLKTLVLDPLQMDSTFAPWHMPYQPMSGSHVAGGQYAGYGFTSFMTLAGGMGDLASTPQEMVQWYSRLFGGQVLTDSSLRQLKTIDPATGYGLGITEGISPRLGADYFHDGAYGAYESNCYYDKDTKATIFLATNSLNDSTYSFPYTAALLDAFVKDMPKYAADASVTGLLSPTGVVCAASVTPVVTLKNSGSAPLTAAVIRLSVDGTVAATFNWGGTLSPGATTQVTLPAMPLTNGMHHIKAFSAMPNGVADWHAWNDTFTTRLGANLTTAYTGYFAEGFESATTPVMVWNTNNGMEWQMGVTKLAGYNSAHSLARGNYFNSNYGNVSNIDMPIVRLIASSTPALSFRYAYSTYPGSDDSLQALISADCGATWTSLFHKGGADLSGADSAYDIYFPQTAAEWTTETISLSAYTGDVLVRFRQFNGNGNNIYLDDIAIGSPTGMSDAATVTMALYPNPARDEVVITGLPTGTVIRVNNLTGQTLMETTASNGKMVMDVSKLSPGVYLVSTPFGTKKLVKQ